METRWVARVGTSEMMILRRELAKLTSQPLRTNLMYSELSSKISMPIFSIMWLNNQLLFKLPPL